MSVALPARRLEIDATAVAVSAPLPSLRRALRGLAEQPELPVPVRYLLDACGRPALRAEVPRVAAIDVCTRLAEAALETVLAGGDRHSPRAPRSSSSPGLPVDDPATRDALAELAFPFEAIAGGFAVHVGIGHGPAARIEVSRADDAAGVLCVRATRSLRLDDPSSLHALARYALELNHRLRIARISVDGTAFDVARVVWDVVLPTVLPRERALGRALEAVAVARSVSNGVLAALATPEIAEAYLALRFAHEFPPLHDDFASHVTHPASVAWSVA